MQLAAAVVAVVGMAVAKDMDATTKGESVTSTPPAKCCLQHDQYSAVMTDLATLNAPKTKMAKVQADYNLQKEVYVYAEVDLVTRQSTDTMRTLIDHTKRVAYTVAADDPTKCIKTPYTQPMDKCIRDEAVYLGAGYLGPQLSKLPLDSWKVRVDGADVIVAMTSDCVPALQAVASPSLATNATYLYTETQFRLTDPSLFNLPPACDHSNVIG